jgi:hypothetical protein
MKKPIILLTVFAVFCLSACEKPQSTLRVLQDDVSTYAANPSDEIAAKIDANFAKLDGQIVKLRNAGKTEEADRIASQRDALQAQYAAARMTASLLKAKEAAVNVGQAFRKVGEALGQALKNASTNHE